jgi:hypothetical protein
MFETRMAVRCGRAYEREQKERAASPECETTVCQVYPPCGLQAATRSESQAVSCILQRCIMQHAARPSATDKDVMGSGMGVLFNLFEVSVGGHGNVGRTRETHTAA